MAACNIQFVCQSASLEMPEKSTACCRKWNLIVLKIAFPADSRARQPKNWSGRFSYTALVAANASGKSDACPYLTIYA
jgi:hypothetical protein